MKYINQKHYFFFTIILMLAHTPITNATLKYPNTSHEKLLEAERTRLALNDYNEHGNKNPKWDALAREFIAKISRYEPLHIPPEVLFEYWAMAEKLKTVGCDDPLVKFNRGILLRYLQGSKKAYPFIEENVKELVANKYSDYTLYRGYYSLRNTALMNNSWYRPETERIYKKEVNYFADSVPGRNTEKVTAQLYVYNFVYFKECDSKLNKYRTIIYNKVKNNPDADPWTSNMIQGMYHIKQAWKARGSGWASTVSESGWNGFKSNLAIAVTNLTAAYNIYPDLPEAPYYMMTVAGGSCGSSPISLDEWFKRTTNAEFDYMPAYTRKLWYLRPRWGGSYTEMLNFGKKCLATDRFDTSVPAVFIEAILDISNDADNWREVFEQNNIDEDLKYYFTNAITNKTNTANINFLKSQFAIMMWACHDYKKAKQIITELGDNFDNTAFNSFPVTRYNLLQELQVMTSSNNLEIIEAEKLIKAGNYADGVNLYQQLLEQNKDNPEIYVYILQKLADCGLQMPSESAEHVASAMIKLGLKEKLILSFRKFEIRNNTNSSSNLVNMVQNSVGKDALFLSSSFPARIPPARGGWGFLLSSYNNNNIKIPRRLNKAEATAALTKLDQLIEKLKQEKGIKDITPGSRLDTDILLAKSRIILWQSSDREFSSDALGKKVAAQFAKCKNKGRVLDFVMEHFNNSSLHYSMKTHTLTRYHNQHLFNDDRNNKYINSILNPLEQIKDKNQLENYDLNNIYDNGTVVVLLRAAKYLKEQGAALQGLMVEQRAMNWLNTFIQSTPGRWARWQCMRLLNLVGGYEEDAVFFGEVSIKRGMTESAVLDTALNLVKLHRLDDAVNMICNLRLKSKKHGWYHPKSKYPITDKELSDAIKTIYTNRDLSENSKQKLEIIFPKECLNQGCKQE